MSIFGQTKGTKLEKQIAQLATGEAVGGAMYYALAKVAKEKFGLDDAAKEFIELGNQETNHGAFYAMLNGRYPYDEKTFWQMVKGLSKAEYKGEGNVNQLADKLAELGIDKEAVEQVREFAIQEKHHGEATQAIIEKYAPKDEETTENKPVYVCKVCGFEYVGDLTDAPADYICPVCGMPKTVFEKQLPYHIDRKDPNKWFYLSHAMANEFIPCFELGDAFEGSKPFSEEGLLFYADIREIIKNSPEKIDVKEALAQYSYLFPIEDEPNIESLNTKYYRILNNNRMIKYHFQEAEKFYADKDVENKEELIQEYVDTTIIELAKNLRERQKEEPQNSEKDKPKRVKFVAIPNS